jgi:hypothetical protein
MIVNMSHEHIVILGNPIVLQVMVFWVMALCSYVVGYRVLEDCAASMFRL